MTQAARLGGASMFNARIDNLAIAAPRTGFGALSLCARLLISISLILIAVWSLMIALTYADRRDGTIADAQAFAQNPGAERGSGGREHGRAGGQSLAGGVALQAVAAGRTAGAGEIGERNSTHEHRDQAPMPGIQNQSRAQGGQWRCNAIRC